MNKEQNYLIELLSNHINNIKSEKSDDNIDMELLHEISKEHNVSGIVCKELSKSYSKGELGDTGRSFYQDFLASVKLSVEQESVLKDICINLSNHNIKHILIKGMQIKRLYPASELRTMGDIDIFVHKDDFQRTCTAFEQDDFKLMFIDPNQQAVFKKGCVTIELHYFMSELYGMAKSSFSDKGADCLWDMTLSIDRDFNSVKADKDTSEIFSNFLTPEALFLLVLCHIIKHIKSRGSGIRMFLDTAVISKHYNDVLNWEMIEESLTNMGYAKTCGCIFWMIRKWFRVDIPILHSDFVSDELVSDFEEFVLCHGTFGEMHRNRFTRNMKNGILNNIFVSREHLESSYPALKGRPILIPFFWLHRISSFLSGKRNTKFVAKELVKSIEPAREYRKFLKDIGIN